MSKQILMSNRPPDAPGASSMGGGGGGGDDWPKGSIGNYKGVMLCNRPVDNAGGGREARPDQPFVSRVVPPEQVGWNPTKKLMPRTSKRRSKLPPIYFTLVDPNSVLIKHRRFIKDLESKKNIEKETKTVIEIEAEEKFKMLRD